MIHKKLTASYVKDVFHMLEMYNMNLIKNDNFSIEICTDNKGKILGYAVYNEDEYCYGDTQTTCIEELKKSVIYKSDLK